MGSVLRRQRMFARRARLARGRDEAAVVNRQTARNNLHDGNVQGMARVWEDRLNVSIECIDQQRGRAATFRASFRGNAGSICPVRVPRLHLP
jgi:uncharacterized Fe-S cluster-containing radical SAM superfamily enzyme